MLKSNSNYYFIDIFIAHHLFNNGQMSVMKWLKAPKK